MDKISAEQFTVLFAELCYAFDKPLNELTARVYYKHLSKYPADRITIVINDWIEKELWFPRIAKLIEEMNYVKGSVVPVERQLINREDEGTEGFTSFKEVIAKMGIKNENGGEKNEANKS